MAAVLITRGSRGMALFEPGTPTRHIPIHGSDEIADVTGAGDTVIATMTLALAAGASPFEAAQLANVAGGIVVMKRGTATASAEELRAALVPWNRDGWDESRSAAPRGQGATRKNIGDIRPRSNAAPGDAPPGNHPRNQGSRGPGGRR